MRDSASSLDSSTAGVCTLHTHQNPSPLFDGLPSCNYQIVSDAEADIFEEISICDLTETAKEYGCRILKVKEQDESLESFYLNLMGGAGRD